MSGSPKYSSTRISAAEQARIEARRAAQRALEEEARRAREAAERQRLAEERRAREEAERKRQAELKAEAERKAAEERARRLAEVEGQLEPLLARVSGLQSDAVTTTWCTAELTGQAQALEAARKALGRDEFDAVAAACKDATAALEALEARAQARQLQEEQRNHIVQGMMTVLGRHDFQVGTPVLSCPGDFDSEVVIRAVRTDNRSVRIAVPAAGGSVTYELDGWDKHQVQTRDGRAASACDNAEDTLRAMGDELEQAFGIEVGEIMWDGKDPDRIRKGANELPGSGPSATTVRGSNA
jgi:hypothetical protein